MTAANKILRDDAARRDAISVHDRSIPKRTDPLSGLRPPRAALFKRSCVLAA